jgi:DnaJ like chaperone protein
MEISNMVPFWDFLKNKIGKLLGLIIGFCFANVFGAALGFTIGALIDKLYKDGSFRFDMEERPRNYLQTDFIMSILLLASSILKSDADKDEKEVSFIKKFIAEHFGNEKLEEYFSVLEHSRLKEPDLKKITQQIRINSSYETRLQIIHFLFGLANADDLIHEKEIANIKVISIHLSISAEDFESLKVMFISDIDQYYRILGIVASASVPEIKEAYRKQALKYHPDKTAITYSDNAEENFLRIKEAYDFIKNKRGFT